ncbi:D-glycero-beta-D-manno-heptose 1-phosphate adenylyltransferase [Bdellovibrio bacteriovorus]|uniref:D-glycero-beta-D-manno-heptose 1-phosphate adenylyltransferase n=1 Tax=Bdellovibrio bacteriovorus (strain ATCC 15356 / DSM 50701 / NCIMB 9529 / HD100) TaxID=264462 RepID=Q6MI94_BDEBA|nr:D-glycero-beta-D-manno-heptose 1-phosphate adenylyltransferase [Bdellovibrio bacteriovorus]BEV69619.1 Bifunctional protein HldE [Bdellovibrio bacteriovorus]CAE78086.1 ADP-heptose synthase [Bdellovibrio bacteriovorus HD100]
MGQVCNLDNIETTLAPLRAAGKKIVFTNGCFDLLHVGHVRYLQEAQKLGDLLVVGVNSDASVKRLKGPTRPVQIEADRAEILAALNAVDFTVIFTEDTPENLIHKVRPDILVKGGDWKIDSIVGAPFVMSYGGQVMSLQFVDGKSTTKLIEKAQK